MEHDVLVISIYIVHTGVNNVYTGFEHQFFEFFIRVASWVGFEIALFVLHLVVGQAAWGYQSDVTEVQVTDWEQSFYERDTCIRTANNNDPRILKNFRLTQKSLCGKAESKRWLLFI